MFVDEDGHQHFAFSSALRLGSEGRERACCSVPCNRGPDTTPLASMSAEGMGPCVAVEGTTAVVFETYVEKVLAPEICGGGR